MDTRFSLRGRELRVVVEAGEEKGGEMDDWVSKKVFGESASM